MRTVFVSGITALGLACMPAVAASGVTEQGRQAGESAPGWRLTRVNTLPGDDVLNDVTALGNGSVWAAGHRVVNGRQRGLVQWFDGGSWKVIPGSPPYELKAVTATSDRDVWVFGPGKAARWNGRAWTTASLGSGFSATDADGTGAKDIWAVAESSASARHWNGSSWKSVRLPARAAAVDAYKAGDVGAQRAERARRCVPAPHAVDHLVRRDRVPLPQQEHRENGALQGRAEVEFDAVTPGQDRPKHGEAQAVRSGVIRHVTCLPMARFPTK